MNLKYILKRKKEIMAKVQNVELYYNDTATAFARVVGCSRKTIYNYLSHYENTHGNEYV